MDKGGSRITNNQLIKLTHQSLFSELDIDFIHKFITYVNEFHLLKGELVFRQDERYHKGLYFITSGKIELNNNKRTVPIIREHDVMGITTYLSKTMYKNTATALTDVDIIFIPEVEIYNLISASSKFRAKIIRAVDEKFKEIGDPKNNFLYHKTSNYLMNFIKSPMLTINASSTVMQATAKMKEYSTDCLLVSNRKHTLKGLVSKESLLFNFFLDYENNKDNLLIENYADITPLLLPDELPIDIAFDEMNKAKKRCAIVTSKSKPIGIITATDLIDDITEAIDIHSSYISTIQTVDDAKIYFKNIYKYSENIMKSSRVSRHELIKLSATHIALQERIYQLTSDQFYDTHKFRLSDYDYNFILLGAAARLELDLRPRIINAIILGDNLSDETAKQFIEFSNIFQTNLANIGYFHPECNKPIVNNFFIKRESEWYKSIDEWSVNPKKNIPTSFFCLMDMKSFDGDNMMCKNLDNYIRAKIKDKPSLLLQILNSSPQFKIPISTFGGFILESEGAYKGTINLQSNALYYISILTKLLNLYIDSSELSTINRIKLLSKFKIISIDMADKTIYAFDTLISTLLNEQISLSHNNKPISVSIKPSNLSLVYQEKLLRALQFLSEYSNHMHTFLAKL